VGNTEFSTTCCGERKIIRLPLDFHSINSYDSRLFNLALSKVFRLKFGEVSVKEESVPESADMSSRKNKPALNFLLLSAGSMFTSMIIAGFLVGYVIDLLFDTMPIFLLSCGVLGFIGGMMKVHKLLEKMSLLDTGKAKPTESETSKHD